MKLSALRVLTPLAVRSAVGGATYGQTHHNEPRELDPSKNSAHRATFLGRAGQTRRPSELRELPADTGFLLYPAGSATL